jgi:NADPH:quinone reductase-like Zn-dependent oxidoreductase
MKAVVCTAYGTPDVLKLKDMRKPVPGDDQILIRIHATTVHIGDTRIRRADPFFVRLYFGLSRPKRAPVLGMELAGEIESLGKDVKNFQKGDQVFAFTGFRFGAYAEYICLPARSIKGSIEKKGLVAMKPKNLSYGEAASVPAGALTVLKVFQKTSMDDGKKILINGASGSLGTYAVQMARRFDVEITGVCSTSNIDLVKSLGADRVIDYRIEDFTEMSVSQDIIFDAVGKSSRSRCKNILKKGGDFLTTNGLDKIEQDDLDTLREMIERDEIKPVIDRTYDLEEIVEGHRYVEKGHKKGNVVVNVT